MRSFLLIFFTILSFCVNAQFNTGDKVLGGYLSFSAQRSPDSQSGELRDKSNSFSVSPSLGFFIAENLSIGARLGYSNYVYETYNSSDLTYQSKSKHISPALFAERYFSLSDHFLFSVVGNLSFNRGKETTKQFNQITGEVYKNTSDTYTLSAGLNPTFTFLPSEKWGIQAGVGSLYYSYSRNLSTETKTNSFNLSLGSVSLGIFYYM